MWPAASTTCWAAPCAGRSRPAQLRKKLAILTYCLTSRDAWPDKRINYGWGTMNMPVGRWGGLVVMASAIGDHPMAKEWLKDARATTGCSWRPSTRPTARTSVARTTSARRRPRSTPGSRWPTAAWAKTSRPRRR